MAHKKKYFTIMELIIVMVAALIVLLPIATMMGAIVRDLNTGREIKLLQEELDLASYSIKGLIEEAAGYHYDSALPNSLTLHGQNGTGSVEIRQEQQRLIIDDYPVIDCLHTLEFQSIGDRLIRVNITAERADRTQENSFYVKMRN